MHDDILGAGSAAYDVEQVDIRLPDGAQVPQIKMAKIMRTGDGGGDGGSGGGGGVNGGGDDGGGGDGGGEVASVARCRLPPPRRDAPCSAVGGGAP